MYLFIQVVCYTRRPCLFGEVERHSLQSHSSTWSSLWIWMTDILIIWLSTFKKRISGLLLVCKIDVTSLYFFLEHKTHPSVRIKGTENNYNPVRCMDHRCQDSSVHMHCPFCVKRDFYHDPVILKAHFRVKHVDKGIDFAGLKAFDIAIWKSIISKKWIKITDDDLIIFNLQGLKFWDAVTTVILLVSSKEKRNLKVLTGTATSVEMVLIEGMKP